MTQLWRVHLQTDGTDSRRFCIDKNLVGVGWPIENDNLGVDWPTYEAAARLQYKSGVRGWAATLNALYQRMKVDDLCWARDFEGNYYLGRVLSEWRYEGSEDYVKAGVANVRDVEWLKIRTADRVPGGVLRHFIRGQTIRNIPQQTVIAASQFLFNEEAGRTQYTIELESADLYHLLSPWDLENLIAMYLQKDRNYMLIPRTAESTMPKYEFVLIRENGGTAAVQVKSGSEPGIIADYENIAQDFGEFFLFASSGNYVGNPSTRVECLDPEVIRRFTEKHFDLMPRSIKLFMTLARTLLR